MYKTLYWLMLCGLFLSFQSAFAQRPSHPCSAYNEKIDSAIAVKFPWFGNNAWLDTFYDSLLAARAVRSTPPTSAAAR
ncbi:MAG: hypothetical protein EAZ57_01760 [Cytophagales bacterium]|nr:MAG: hypothetical protein EAZ67_02830 [Cytophagales bacterium]TAF61850.1 MAG: hypothetical protein EAZ57_01760 [Cytophagales bacterium]